MKIPSRAIPALLFLLSLGLSYLFWYLVGGPEGLAARRVSVVMDEFAAVLFLRNYNTRLVVLSTTLLGISAGMTGSFLLLRKRSLMGDVFSHACLPGVGLAFLLMIALGRSGQNLPVLLAGAAISGLVGVWLVQQIRNTPRIHDDAAMGIILSVFFGFGVVLIGIIQESPMAATAGIHTFIYGKTASLIKQDFVLISSTALLVAVAILLFQKELTLLCFDKDFASTQGWPVQRLDMLLLGLVAAVTVVGLQAVGLILIVAFLITPAAAARFWTEDIKNMQILAGAIGGLSGWLGATLSALLPQMPAGAIVVLSAAAIFLLSLLFGRARGAVHQLCNIRNLKNAIALQDLLRAVFELQEQEGIPQNGHMVVRNLPVPLQELLRKRSWTTPEVLKIMRRAQRSARILPFDGQSIQLSEAGFGEAARFTHNHRLWTAYLLTHADTAPQYVDRDADAVEHVLAPHLIRKLEAEMVRRGRPLTMPPIKTAVFTNPTPQGGC